METKKQNELKNLSKEELIKIIEEKDKQLNDIKLSHRWDSNRVDNYLYELEEQTNLLLYIRDRLDILNNVIDKLKLSDIKKEIEKIIKKI